MLRHLTAGESHGKAIIGILEGVPANLKVSPEDINKELKRRMLGYGRGGRMAIETDNIEVLSGIRLGKTLGSPIALMIENKDYENWKKIMPVEASKNIFQEPVTKIRPGHADLTGCLKYNQQDIRNILERASARSTAALVAIGAVAKKLLSEFKISVFSHVVQIGKVRANVDLRKGLEEARRAAEKSDVRCADEKAALQMKKEIDEAKTKGDSLGGVFEVVVTGAPVGLGSHVHADRRLGGKLAGAVMSINAVKGVEIGLGFSVASVPGSKAHDELFNEAGNIVRHSNNAGGLEGGMTNGEPIIIRAAVKPVSTIKKTLNSVDLITKESVKAHFERADVCHIPSAGVIGEAVVAIEMAGAFLEKFGGDSIEEIKARYAP
ncbi:chorismate synthase [Candidatus Margulisiibacteriota bacterium]